MAIEMGLRYGLAGVIPESAVAAWGARLIHDEVIAGGRGIVFDRQDLAGESPARDILVQKLNESQDIDDAIEDYAKGVAGSVKAKTVVYSDDDVAVVISPNGSFGYLYVSAYLKR